MVIHFFARYALYRANTGIWCSPGLFKTKHIIEFLEEGNKVKVTIRFRGRELAHTELGKDVLMKAIDLLNDQEVGFNVDIQPKMEGRFMSMILSPKNKK